MYFIDQRHRNSFIKQMKGFNFKGKKNKNISNYKDIKAVIDFIYKTKAVLYRRRNKNYSDKWSLGGNAAAKNALDKLLDDLAQCIYGYFNKPGNVANN